MPFFEDVQDMKIVENHIISLQRLEEKDGERLIRSYRRIRSELTDRLALVPEGSFTAQRYRSILVQIESALRVMADGLLDDLSPEAFDAARRGVTEMLAEIRVFSRRFEGAVTPLDVSAIGIATEAQNLAVNRYKASLEQYTGGVRAQIARGLLDAVLAQDTVGQAIQRLTKFFAAEEWKLRRLARTELHGIYNLGRLTGMRDVKRDFIPNLKKTLIHPMDDRTGEDSKVAAQKELIVDIDKPFRYTFKGNVREFMTPPDRPNDRAIVVPYRDEWDT